jgi:hypothetical protein
MADNIQVQGVTYASDDVAGVHYTRVKMVHGADGQANDASEASPLPVRDGSTISTHHLITAASANPANVKAAPGRLRSVHIFNAESVPIYVKFHDTAGSPTAGSGVVFSVGCQAGLHRDVMLPGAGRAFATGIGRTVVRDAADAGTTACAAGNTVEVGYE